MNLEHLIGQVIRVPVNRTMIKRTVIVGSSHNESLASFICVRDTITSDLTTIDVSELVLRKEREHLIQLSQVL